MSLTPYTSQRLRHWLIVAENRAGGLSLFRCGRFATAIEAGTHFHSQRPEFKPRRIMRATWWRRLLMSWIVAIPEGE